MAEQKAQYFPASISLPKQLLNEVQELEKQIEQLIQAGQMKIQEKQELQGKKEQKDQKKILKQKLKQLGSIKYELATKLKSIDMQQRAIKAQKHRLQSQNHKNKMQKSVLTEQQKQRIVRVRKQQKQFQQKIKEKIEGIMSQIKQKQQQEQQEKRFKQDLKRKQRIVRMTEKKVKLAESRSKTLQILENSHLSIKKSEYVYMKNQEKDKKALKARQQQIEQVLREKKQKQRVDFEEIKEYAQQHDRIINQKKQQFLFEFKENQVRKRTKTLIYESQYGKRLKSEERRRELQKIKQINAKRQVRDRIQNFQSVISEKYKPKCTEDSAFVPKKQVEVLERLTFEQARQKGKEFLKIARKKAKKLTPHQSKIEVSSDKIGPSDYLPTSSSEKYPNYLVEFKSKNGQQSVLDRILKQKRVSSRKMQEVIRWMKKKQQGYNIGPHKSPSKSQFNSALQKIKLLNSMYQNETLQI